ncbi:MAG: pilus assembly protein [Azospirillaceae bacterium]|nr:pilus assembly protein [Azospirillaceae bacterium]
MTGRGLPLRAWFACVGRFWRATGAVSILEFSLIGVPFLMLLLGVVEMSYMLKTQADLDYATQTAARQIMTGTVQANSPTVTPAQFATQYICPNLPSTFTCGNVIVVMSTIVNATGKDFSSLINASHSGVTNNSNSTTICLGTSTAYVFIQVYYKIQGTIFAFTGIADLTLGSSLAFRNEPFHSTKYSPPSVCS